jgi:hypothetical protein
VAAGKTNLVERLSPVPIRTVIFGVRYEPQWALHDRIGAIVDAVLREPGTPFGPELFGLNTVDPMMHTLMGKNGEYLKVNQQDTILRVMAGDTRNLSRVTQIGEQFAQYVLQPLREIGRVRGIVRTGMILQLADARGSLKDPPINRYLADDVQNVTSLAMRFTRRLAAPEALVKKRVTDYRNVIYSVNESEEGEVITALDYQHSYVPPLDGKDWDERPFAAYVEGGLQYFEGEFQKWFQKLAGVPEVA